MPLPTPTDADVNAALFSEADLTITGTGSLTVTGNGNDGITSEDDLVDPLGRHHGRRGRRRPTRQGLAARSTAERSRWTLAATRLKSDERRGGHPRLHRDIERHDHGEIRGRRRLGGRPTSTPELTAGASSSRRWARSPNPAASSWSTASHGDARRAQRRSTAPGRPCSRRASEVPTRRLEGAYISIEGGDVAVAPHPTTASTSPRGRVRRRAARAAAWAAACGDTGETLDITRRHRSPSTPAGDGLDSNGSMTISAGNRDRLRADERWQRRTRCQRRVRGDRRDRGGRSGAPAWRYHRATASSQAWVSALASGAAGDTVEIVDASGTVVAAFTAEKTFGSVVFTSADLVDGATYTVTVDGSTAATVTEGTATAGGMGGMGGGPGGGGQRP